MQPDEWLTALARVRLIHGGEFADLEFLNAPRCAGCEGVCLWRRVRKTSLRIPVSADLRDGDTVAVALPVRAVLQGALLLHGLPWVGLLIGAATGAGLGAGGDLRCLLGAAAGLVAGLLLASRLEARWEPVTPAKLIVVPKP